MNTTDIIYIFHRVENIGWLIAQPIPLHPSTTYNFEEYKFRINGVVYTEQTPEFLEIMERLRIIRRLSE